MLDSVLINSCNSRCTVAVKSITEKLIEHGNACAGFVVCEKVNNDTNKDINCSTVVLVVFIESRSLTTVNKTICDVSKLNNYFRILICTVDTTLRDEVCIHAAEELEHIFSKEATYKSYKCLTCNAV